MSWPSPLPIWRCDPRAQVRRLRTQAANNAARIRRTKLVSRAAGDGSSLADGIALPSSSTVRFFDGSNLHGERDDFAIAQCQVSAVLVYTKAAWCSQDSRREAQPDSRAMKFTPIPVPAREWVTAPPAAKTWP
jgi:hypothetical protein